MFVESSVCLYPISNNSFASFINDLNTDFSSTIFIYFSTFAVVGTFSGNSAKYCNPPIASNFNIDVNSSLTVIISIAPPFEYIFIIDLKIVLLSSL